MQFEAKYDQAETLDDQISTLVHEIRDDHDQIETLEARIRAAKDQLRELLEQRGENWSDEHGYARLTNEGIRTAYDTKALDTLIITQPLQYGWLKDYRKETPVQGTIHVK